VKHRRRRIGFVRAAESAFLWAVLAVILTGCHAGSRPIGIFENCSDVGLVSHTASAKLIEGGPDYEITAGGANIWAEKDAFGYLWKRASGDFSLTTGIRWIGAGKNDHRKAGWMIRQSLAADSAYVDAVVHGDGLTCLQFRKVKGGQTEEIKSAVSAPAFIRLERYGDVFSMYVSKDAKEYQPVGSVSAALKKTVYVGLAVCSHEDDTTETAVFSRVAMKAPGPIDRKTE